MGARRARHPTASGRPTSRKRATTGRSRRGCEGGARKSRRKYTAGRKQARSVADGVDGAAQFPPFKHMVIRRNQVESEERKKQLKILIAHKNTMPQANGRVHVKDPVTIDDRQVGTRKRGMGRTKSKDG